MHLHLPAINCIHWVNSCLYFSFSFSLCCLAITLQMERHLSAESETTKQTALYIWRRCITPTTGACCFPLPLHCISFSSRSLLLLPFTSFSSFSHSRLNVNPISLDTALLVSAAVAPTVECQVLREASFNRSRETSDEKKKKMQATKAKKKREQQQS